MKIIPKKSLQQQLQDKEYFLKETAAITQTGSYSGNLNTGFCFMDETGRRVLNLPADFVLDFQTAPTLFVNSKEAIMKFRNCMLGQSFEQDVEMVDYDGNKLWVRATGKPLYNTEQNIVGIRGVFTSIDRFIRQGKELEKRAQLIEAQNERLVHFAHIVSHNLRSHSSNLELTLDTFTDLGNEQELTIFKSYLKDISSSLSQTLEHLNEVVTIHTHEKGKELVDIRQAFQEVVQEHQSLLEGITFEICQDFTSMTHIRYVPSFLKSIFTNLLSNAIKYRHPSRELKISVRTRLKNKKQLLIFKDNGIGIDLDKNGSKIFNMYRTFHDNTDANGVGLFLTKNQVESLGGDICVKSVVGVGSSFTIKF